MPEGWTKWTSAPPTCASARWPSMRNWVQANSNLHWPWWQLGSHCRICELALHLAENFWYLAARIVKHNVIPKSIVEYLLCNWCQTFPWKGSSFAGEGLAANALWPSICGGLLGSHASWIPWSPCKRTKTKCCSSELIWCLDLSASALVSSSLAIGASRTSPLPRWWRQCLQELVHGLQLAARPVPISNGCSCKQIHRDNNAFLPLCF